MTTRPSEPSSRRRTTEVVRLERPGLVADHELRPQRAPESRRTTPPPVYLLAFGEPLPPDYYLG